MSKTNKLIALDKAARYQIYLLCIKLALIVTAGLIVFKFILGICLISGNYMSPNVKDGDLCLYSRINFEYTSKDIVVYRGADNVIRVGRIIACPKTMVELDEFNNVVINGNKIIENDIYSLTKKQNADIKYPIELKNNEYFILGDNRENSIDSRTFGPIKESDILGSIFVVLRRKNF